MIRNIIEELNEEDRRRLGEPPTFEEIEAYSRGELSAEDEQRVRELLVAYPEIARTMTFSFEKEEGVVVPFRRHVWTAIAAALAIVFAGLYWQAESNAKRFAHELSVPRVATDEQVLLPDGRRGPEVAPRLSAAGDSYVLAVSLIGEKRYPQYRLEIVDAKDKVLWTRDGVQPRDNDTFSILVPHAFFAPGTYRIVVYGDRDEIATYTFRV